MGFYRNNAWWLFTGFLFMFGSAPGQTFFIAQYAGELRATFGLSNGDWGALYTLATIASAACLMTFGRYADTLPLARLATIIFTLYAAAAITMGLTTGPVMLVLAVFGLRFCGQGMMGLMAMTAMARWFRANRGRAVSIAALGFPISEALFPFIVVLLVAALGWRGSWFAIAALILLVVLPAILTLLRRDRVPQGEGGAEMAAGMDGKHWTKAEVLRHWSFWLLLPGLMAPPFIGTCAFFHQAHIAEVRGYDFATMTLAFPMYATVTITTSLVAGAAIDRYGVARLLPFLLLPMIASMAVLAIPGGVWVWFAMLACVGLSQGFVITMMGTLWPTLYGTQWIGSVKSASSAAMVIATALGPGVTGLIIDAGVDFPGQAPFLAAYCVVISALFVWAAPRIGARLPSPGLVANPA